MSDTLLAADNETKYHCYRLCRAAGLPERGWHILRHAFGTHAAMFGVNPWKLMLWMGHKRIDETMLYVHFAEAQMRPTPRMDPRSARWPRRPGSPGPRDAECTPKCTHEWSSLQRPCSKRGVNERKFFNFAD